MLATLGAALAAVASWRFGSKLLGREGREHEMKHAGAEKKRKTPRALQGVYPPGPEHWVGDGFHVKPVF